jgi:predicted nucleotidyltransferase component of viral defense system
MNLYEKIFKSLNKVGIKYIVVGGVAVNLHGYMRFTGDLDLLVMLDEENLQKMDKLMQKLDYTERLPIPVLSLQNTDQVKKWLTKKNMKAYSFIPPKDNPLQIDIVIEESLKFEKIAAKKIIKKIEDVSIPVVSIEDLIKMKKKSDRPQDIIDIKALNNLKKE